MRVSIFLFLLLFCSKSLLFSQIINQNPSSNVHEEVVAQFPGGQTAYNKYLETWLKPLPESCRGKDGTTVIQASISETGLLSEFRFLERSGCAAFDSICMVSMQAMPRWQPHLRDGKPASGWIALTIFMSNYPTRLPPSWAKNLRVGFFLPVGGFSAVGGLRKNLKLGVWAGIGICFEGKKWGIEDVLCFDVGGSRVKTAFSENGDWRAGRKVGFSVIQLGLKRILFRNARNSVWAVGGLSFTTLRPKKYEGSESREVFVVDATQPYLGAIWRKGIWPKNGASYGGQLFTRFYPFASPKVAGGVVISFGLAMDLLTGGLN